jgi:hypothetical protein
VVSAPSDEAVDEGFVSDRFAELRATLLVFFGGLRMAAVAYDPSRPEDARACVRIALVGMIQIVIRRTTLTHFGPEY